MLDQKRGGQEFNAGVLIEVVENTSGIPRKEFCGSGKSVAVVAAKEVLVLTGCQVGANLKMLSEITGLSSSAVSRRYDAAKLKVRHNRELSKLAANIMKLYRTACVRIAESQA